MDAPARSGRGVGFVVLIVVAVLVALLAVGGVCVLAGGGMLTAIAVPSFVGYQQKAKRAEVTANVDGIRTAELAYDAAFDKFVAAGDAASAPATLTTEPHPFPSDASFEALGWQPDGPVRGAYWVVVTGDTFTVHGIIDADGDGVYAEYVASDGAGEWITAPDVY